MTEKRMRWVRLGHNILAVAVEGAVADWAAYIDAVPGVNHTLEVEHVKTNGDKLPEDVARAIFPAFRDLSWRR